MHELQSDLLKTLGSDGTVLIIELVKEEFQHRALYEQFQENAQYHSICITKYLLKDIKVEKV
jgi:hypothetical protein